jgi:lysozyme
MAATDELDDDDFVFVILAGATIAFAYEFYLAGGIAGLQQLISSAGFSSPTSTPASSPGAGTTSGGALPMVVSPQGQAFIKQNEGGFSATPYRDGNGFSIGWGHHFPAGTTPPNSASLAEGEAWFASDIAGVESTLNSAVHVSLTQDQFDALADFVFNVGASAFLGSTLLRVLNAGNYGAAAQQFAQWRLAGGKVSAGLVRRRAAEKQLFITGGAIA